MPHRGFEGDLVLWTQVHSKGHPRLAKAGEKGNWVYIFLKVGGCNDVDFIVMKIITAT